MRPPPALSLMLISLEGDGTSAVSVRGGVGDVSMRTAENGSSDARPNGVAIPRAGGGGRPIEGAATPEGMPSADDEAGATVDKAGTPATGGSGLLRTACNGT